MEAPRTDKVKMVIVDTFEGTTDPEEHLSTYKAQMGVQTGCDATWCRWFLTTLKGLTLTWFTNLPHGCITCFWYMEMFYKKKFLVV